MSDTMLADLQPSISFDDDFTLNLTVVESLEPIAQLRCDTSDGCGSTCATSACNSATNNPF
ncbi:FxLD family lantipeptide [Stackebrandtia albiflava]|uniref:FxLD family lantipeptide n=1 Tax=Stackebrandtia albiflava TaxID=406432 RepID=A0A562UQ14_9ACTN|nr:FxLD family lanthipeptide [Stackebrandtia albiflava]TWJ07715.1 FxLD family lantipeptide [Stackebrandtia albiflava]